MTGFDDVADKNREDELRAWTGKVARAARNELAQLVQERRGGGAFEEVVTYYKGAFNVCIRMSFDDDRPDAILRLAKAGYIVFRDEKVTNEVEVLKFLRQNTTIPVPEVIDWGLTVDCPQELGPFIIMDYVEGVHMCDLLAKPNEDKTAPLILDPAVDNEMLDNFYQQIAGYMLQLYQFDFSAIGAILQDNGECRTWSATHRPLTYDMNELVTCAAYPMDDFSSEPFHSARAYVLALANQHLNHLRTQRNLADDEEDAERRYVSRHLFAQLADERYAAGDDQDAGPFKLFCDDLRPSNMLVDKDTLQITAILDFEFTNAMLAQFAQEPPWWLLLRRPSKRLDDDDPIEEFLEEYQPRLDQFLRALEHEETKTGTEQTAARRLSTLMRNSWQQGEFWFNIAARHGFDIDAVFYAYFDRANFGGQAGADMLAKDLQRDMKGFVEMKMEQKTLHDLELLALGSDKSESDSDSD